MLQSIKKMDGHRIRAVDGDIGWVKEFYFDDNEWTIRYLVADTGHWLPGRKVLIAPTAFDQPDWDFKKFPVLLTKEQVEKSPSIKEHMPVSREHEYELNEHYGWKIYWAQGPVIFNPAKVEPELEEYAGDFHLRSTNEITGYHIHACDGDIGHVEDFILEDDSWIIRYIVVDTRNWLPGKKVLFSPHWIKECNCHDRKICVDLLCKVIKGCPKYKHVTMLNREYEERLFDHYGQKKYWE